MTILDTDVLVADAQESTGLTDFGDDTLPGRVALVVDRLNRAELDEQVRGQRNTRSADSSTSRLCFVADHAHLPLAAVQIRLRSSLR